ncbi:MAG: hypothetical protein N3D17_07255 [bacterium]|nr:hypothetical protein [bacterium]
MRYILLFFLLFFTLSYANGDDPYKLYNRYREMEKKLRQIEVQINEAIENQKETTKDIENLKYVKKVLEEIAEKYRCK